MINDSRRPNDPLFIVVIIQNGLDNRSDIKIVRGRMKKLAIPRQGQKRHARYQ